METGTTPELAVLKLIWALRYEAPRAQLSGSWFHFPRKGWAVEAAEKLFASLGHPLGLKNEVKLRLARGYVSILHLMGERPMMAVIVPEGGERLIFSARGTKVEAPYDHAYVELYTLLWKRMRQRRERNYNDGAVGDAVEYFLRSWQALNGGWRLDPPSGGTRPPFDGGWPDVPPGV